MMKPPLLGALRLCRSVLWTTTSELHPLRLARSDISSYFHSIQGMARHSQSESTISLQSAHSSLSYSSRHDGGSWTAELPPTPLHAAANARAPEAGYGPRSESLISQSVSPRVQSPILSTRSFSSISERLVRNVAPALRPSLSRQPTPRLPSPILSPRLVSPQLGAAPPPKSASRSGSSLKPSVTTGKLSE